MSILNTVSLGLAGSLLAMAAQAASPSPLYTAAQASAGAAAYAQNCAMCHGANLGGGGGPALVGPSVASATVGSVFSVLARQMPATNPGGLSHTQYDDIMAYVLQKNGDPAGVTPISYDTAMSDTTPLLSQAK